jgi:hypothetical protein
VITVENDRWYRLPSQPEERKKAEKIAIQLDNKFDSLLGANGFTRIGKDGLDLIYVATKCLKPGSC